MDGNWHHIIWVFCLGLLLWYFHEISDDVQDCSDGLVSEDFDEAGEQIDALVHDVSNFEDCVCLIVQEVVLVDLVLPVVTELDDHVAAHCH